MDRGDRFGEYVIIRRLASGGMATVYLARKAGVSGFTKAVAMKVILPQFANNKQFIQMFLDEARLAVFLNHAHIAAVLDLGEVNGQYFISMEFAHGMDLQQISKKTRKSGRLLPLPYAAKIVSQIAEGLYYAHTKVDNTGRPLNIIHRDISPHNVILTFDGLAKLIDFGIAKATVTFKEEEDGVLKGKFSYMSPEQIRGMPLDPRSDIFALGIVLWEVCTGANLYRESSELLTMEAILRKPVPKPRELRGDMPADLEAIILKALAKRTVDRFQTAHEMHDALEGYLNRSGWNVGTPHLSEFMRKLFPEDYAEIRDLLDSERAVAEQEEKAAQKVSDAFVPWVPYVEEQTTKPSQLRPLAPLAPVRPATTSSRPPVTAPPPAPARRGSWMPILLIVLLLMLLAAGGMIMWLLSTPSASNGSGGPAAVAPAVRGSLHVESTPSEAQVYVNSRLLGSTPLDAGDLPLGEELTVRLEKDGFEPVIIPVRLSASKPSAEIKTELQGK